MKDLPCIAIHCRMYDNAKGQLRSPRPDQMVPGADYAMFNDLGVYGVPKAVKDKKRYIHGKSKWPCFSVTLNQE